MGRTHRSGRIDVVANRGGEFIDVSCGEFRERRMLSRTRRSVRSRWPDLVKLARVARHLRTEPKTNPDGCHERTERQSPPWSCCLRPRSAKPLHDAFSARKLDIAAAACGQPLPLVWFETQQDQPGLDAIRGGFSTSPACGACSWLLRRRGSNFPSGSLSGRSCVRFPAHSRQNAPLAGTTRDPHESVP